MKKSLNKINPVITSHDVGQKRVLLAANESGCSLTQIAVIDLKAGEVAQAHIHPDMQEGFYVLEGNLDVKLDDETFHCTKDDFVYVKSLTSHELKAITDVRIKTIGCVIESQQSKLYPFLFEPNLHEIIWGGQKLTDWKGLAAKDHIGESWEVSCVESSPSSAKRENEFSSLRSLLSQFIESEMRSCSMDYGCITPEYVQRAWGGRVAIEDITQGLTELRKQGFSLLLK